MPNLYSFRGARAEFVGEYDTVPQYADIAGGVSDRVYMFSNQEYRRANFPFVAEWAPPRRANDFNSSVPTMCAVNLPPGTTWWGTYYAAFVDTNTHSVYTLTGNEHSCPHCALAEADGILAGGNIAATYANRVHAAFIVANPGSLDEEAYCRYELQPGQQFTWPRAATPTSANYATTKAEITLGSMCSHCGFPGHNRRTCWAKAWEKCHDKVGLEIEGRYYNLGQMQTAMRGQPGMSDADDGSIARQGQGRPREFRTTPGPVAIALAQLLEFYPDETDRSCGLHVHVSFQDPSHITQLAHPKFYAYFKAQFLAWGAEMNLPRRHQFWPRINGQNSYCRENVEVRNILDDDRYRQLNFTSYSRHQTLECRVLPMFRVAEHAVSAVQKLLQIYETWLGEEYERQVEAPKAEVVAQFHQFRTRDLVLDLADFLTPPVRASREVAVAEVKPPPAGWRRVVLTPEIDGANLARILTRVA